MGLEFFFLFFIFIFIFIPSYIQYIHICNMPIYLSIQTIPKGIIIIILSNQSNQKKERKKFSEFYDIDMSYYLH
jgi:hypothetical protein